VEDRHPLNRSQAILDISIYRDLNFPTIVAWEIEMKIHNRASIIKRNFLSTVIELTDLPAPLKSAWMDKT
jgi:hypothetical protein